MNKEQSQNSSQNSKRGKFMRISLKLLEMIDFNKPYEFQLALTLLFQGQAMSIAWDESLLQTTPSLLIKSFGKYETTTRQQEKNINSALIDMRDRGLIVFDKDVKFKENLEIDTKPLLDLANQGYVYVELLINDFYNIMRCDNTIIINNEEKVKDGIESLLLQSFLVVKSRWNFKTIDMLATVEDFNYAITTDKEVQEAKGVFCSDTLDFIRTHKHYELEEVEAWCDDRYLKAYLDKLVELKCIKIYSRKMKTQDGIAKTRRFYYIPTMKFKCIDAMVRQYARRNNFVINEQEEPVQPVEQKEGSFVQQHRNSNATTGRQKPRKLD